MKVRRFLFLFMLILSLIFTAGCNITVDENGNINFGFEDSQVLNEPDTTDTKAVNSASECTITECPAEEPCPECPITECPVITCPAQEPCPEPIESDFTEERLMDTRNLIRQSNITVKANLYNRGFGNTLILAGTSLGSGVVYKQDGTTYYAITNHHVIDTTGYYSARYSVVSYDGTEVNATVVASDPTLDLAIVKFTSSINIPLMDITERENVPLETDEFLLAVGNPSGVVNVVTFGLYIDMTSIQNVDYEVLHHSVQIYHGNSGGALTDLFGNLVGINTWGDENDSDNNFAIPLSVVLKYLREQQLM